MIEWWYWVVLGVALCVAELALPMLILIWLGVAAVLTGVLMYVVPLPLTGQLLFWGFCSVVLTTVFLRWFKPRSAASLAREASHSIGEVGLVTRAVEAGRPGEILFQKPVAGADRWPCVAAVPIAGGARARVVAHEDSVLRIEPV